MEQKNDVQIVEPECATKWDVETKYGTMSIEVDGIDNCVFVGTTTSTGTTFRINGVDYEGGEWFDFDRNGKWKCASKHAKVQRKGKWREGFTASACKKFRQECYVMLEKNRLDILKAWSVSKEEILDRKIENLKEDIVREQEELERKITKINEEIASLKDEKKRGRKLTIRKSAGTRFGGKEEDIPPTSPLMMKKAFMDKYGVELDYSTTYLCYGKIDEIIVCYPRRNTINSDDSEENKGNFDPNRHYYLCVAE